MGKYNIRIPLVSILQLTNSVNWIDNIIINRYDNGAGISRECRQNFRKHPHGFSKANFQFTAKITC